MKAFPLCAIVALTSFLALAAESPRVLPAASLPDDIRLQPPKDLDGYFPFSRRRSKVGGKQRAAQKTQMQVALGL